MQVMVFFLNKKKYGIELNHCKEIASLEKITAINYESENFKPYIEGITNLRGEIITLINPKKLLRMEDVDIHENSYLIRLKIKKARTALIIDEIYDILHVSEDEKDHTKSQFPQHILPFVAYTFLHNHEPIIVLNPESL